MMLRRPQWPAPVITVLTRLEESGYEAYVVGGSVRDVLLKHTAADYDIATNALPDQVAALFSKVKTVGLKHGTVTVILNHMPVEVTTYRVDGDYSDGRRPDAVSYTSSIDDDLARRDFTVNAMAMTLRGDLRDPFGGLQDLDAKVLRAVGTPELRFAEDSLRIFRGLRFQSQLGFTFEPRTLAAMYCCSAGLKNISSERIGQEFRRLALGDWWRVRELLATGPWLEETSPNLRLFKNSLAKLAPFQSIAPQWYDVLAGAPRDAAARLTAFLVTVLMTLNANVSEEKLKFLFAVRQLAWPKQMVSQAREIARLTAEDPACWQAAKWRRILYEAGARQVELACRLADWRYRTGTSGDFADLAFRDFMEFRKTQPLCEAKDLRINGRALLALGANGAQIGLVKQRLIADVLAGSVPNEEKALIARGKALLKEFSENEHSQ